jgi:DNA-directed RNA polymerase specialized sigma24 family protein
MNNDWRDWWRRHGDERRTLLLWAVWNPIGPVPLDEYESYTGPVAAVLHRTHRADLELTAGNEDVSEFAQRQRNKLRESAAEELARLLAKLRDERMGMPPDPDVDRRAAETLLDWYEWEMDELTRSS